MQLPRALTQWICGKSYTCCASGTPTVSAPRIWSVELLEDREVLSVTAQEQLFVYLLNRARHNPVAYQQEMNLPVSLAGVTPQPPLAINNFLAGSSGFHATEMATYNYFAHQSAVTGDWPNKMARDAGYALPSWWPNNLNNIESLAAGTIFPTAASALNALIVDEGVPNVGHRVHLLGMNDFFASHREVGVGYAFNASATYDHYWAVHTGHVDPNDVFLTGVVYLDSNQNGRYDLNEGLGNVNITAGNFAVTTNAAGGWSLKVPNGTYTVVASGGSFSGTAAASVTVQGQNVEVDFRSGHTGAQVNFQEVGSALPLLSTGILGRGNGQWWIARSNGAAFVNQPMGSWSTAVNWTNVISADVTGDGRQDIVGRDPLTGNWWVGVSNGQSFTNRLFGNWSPLLDWVDVQAADLNNDGRLDLVGRAASNGQWWAAVSNGSSFTNQFLGVWAPSMQWVDVHVADLNNDGRDDIVGRCDVSGQWWAGVSNGSAFTNEFLGLWSTEVDWVDVSGVDFNGDGRTDVVGRIASTGQWWAALANGNSFTMQPIGIWAPSADWIDVAIGDFNADGRGDIFGRSRVNGQWWVGISNGTSLTNQLVGTWSTAVTWIDVGLVDVNEDGRTDVVGRIASTGDWWAGVAQGTALSMQRFGNWSTAIAWVDVQAGRVGTGSGNMSMGRPVLSSRLVNEVALALLSAEAPEASRGSSPSAAPEANPSEKPTSVVDAVFASLEL